VSKSSNLNSGRRAVVAAAASMGALGASGFSAPASAQSTNYPNKPIRLIVPFPPGGGTDAFARPLSKVLSQQLGQNVIIDNKGGAGGTLGADLASKAPNDGYTLLMGAVHHTIAVSMYAKLGYSLQRDLVPITAVSYVPNVVVVNPDRMPAKNMAEFMRLVKANPGKYNYASAGNGTTHHLTVEQFKVATKSFVVHVPYRGAGPALQDLLAGQVDFMFDGLGSSIQHIKSGKILPMAVSSAQRSPALPNIPTIAESGVKDYEARTWYGVWAPAGTPKDIALKLQTEIKKALETKELKDMWANLGAEPGGQSSEEFAKFIDTEIKKWAKVVKDSGARLD
jgi:tripartite-type tricarboxylate transporter receptor subunit TctC